MRGLFSITAAFAILVCSTALAAPATGPAAYRLGVGDQIRLRVFDWRPSIGDVHQWTALDGDYRVGADGTASLPLLGAVNATGLTTEQLAARVSQGLQAIVGQTIQPRASVEVVKYRPFYILGDVNKPGAYPYRPGLTVLQAIGIAGGTFRLDDQATLLTTARDLYVLRLRYRGLLARRSRLEAELSGAATVSFPPELLRRQNDPSVARLMRREQAIFLSDREAYSSELETLVSLKKLLSGEIASLNAKTHTVDQEVALTERELHNTTALVARGLAVAPREFTEREAALQTQGRRLDLDTAALRAKEDTSKADQAIVQLQNKTRGQVESELAKVDQELSEARARTASDSAIVGRNTQTTDGAPAPVRCVITRPDEAGSKQVDATGNSAVEPGDTVQVLRPREDLASLPGETAVAEDPPSGTPLPVKPPPARK